nr:hypothetical protein [Tanacetum cinerariifolium]
MVWKLMMGEIYFVKFIINPEEDDSDPGVILGRSFLRLAHGVVDFGNMKYNAELDGKTVKEEEGAVKRIKGEALKEKDDPGAFVFPIRKYAALQRRTHDGEARSSRSKRPRQHEIVEEVLLLQVYHEFLLWKGCSRDYNLDDMLRIRLHEAGLDEEIFTSVAWLRAFNINEPIYAKLCHEFIPLMSLMKGSIAGVPRVGISKPPRASLQDLYDRMGRMEIRQEAIEHMEYRQSYH